jgi:hypothetical protein
VGRRPEPDDPKGPRYTLWKLGLWPFDPEVVYGAMGHTNADDLVVGKTLEQVAARFDRLHARDERPTDLYPDRDIRWLGDSPFLVFVERDRVVALRNVKGS